MVLVFIAEALVVAVVCHRFIRRLFVATAIAPVAATLVWFGQTLPFALMDGWRGWHEELPYVVQAIAICLCIGLGVSAVVGIVMHRADTRPTSERL